jgi:spermidine synthase
VPGRRPNLISISEYTDQHGSLHETPAGSDGTLTSRTGTVRGLLAITVVVSACSLLYELLIAQTLSLLAGNTVVWYSLTVGAYLGAMGLGAMLFRPATEGKGWTALYAVELLLSVVGAASVVLIHLAHSVQLYLSPVAGGPSLFVFYGVSLTMTLLVGLLSGIELPLLIQIGNDATPDGELTNRVLGWDYIGALLAGVLFPMVLVPFISLPVIGFGTALVNLSVAVYVLRRFVPRDSWMLEKTVATTAIGAVLLLGIAQGADIQQYFLKRYYFHLQASERGLPFNRLDDLPSVTRAYSPYQKIDLVYDPSGFPTDTLLSAYSRKWELYPDFPAERFLFLNGDFQVSSSHEESYHEWFAHVPIIMSGGPPERVLVMGAGDGILVRELVKYDGIRTIKHIDLDRTLIELAQTDSVLVTMNRGALADPRVDIEFGDAFQYLRKSSEQFDAIYLDFPYAKDYNLSKLFSREFFHFVREHLAEGGFAVLDAPGSSYYSEPDEAGIMRMVPGGEWEIYYNTMRAAGFESIIPYHAALEPENAAAFALLDEWSGTPDFLDPMTAQPRLDLRIDWMGRVIQQHIVGFREKFIVMWNGQAPTPEYRDFGNELLILNERRFNLSFPPPFPLSAEIDPDRVNSILRPRLPTGDLWSTRRPWN